MIKKHTPLCQETRSFKNLSPLYACMHVCIHVIVWAMGIEGEGLAFMMLCVKILHVVFSCMGKRWTFLRGYYYIFFLPLPMYQVLILRFCFVANFVLWDHVLGKDASKARHQMQSVQHKHRLRPCLPVLAGSFGLVFLLHWPDDVWWD